MKPLVAFLMGIWIWGLLTWTYVVATILDPVTSRYQYTKLSAYIPIPVDLVGVTAFAVAFVAFILWEWLK